MELTKEEKQVLWAWAEDAVDIKPWEKKGRWTRESRVLLVFSVLCALVRI